MVHYRCTGNYRRCPGLSLRTAFKRKPAYAFLFFTRFNYCVVRIRIVYLVYCNYAAVLFIKSCHTVLLHTKPRISLTFDMLPLK